MPPDPVTDFDLTQETPGRPLLTASWKHPNADRFEVLYRIGEEPWRSLILAPVADFDLDVDTYSVAVPSLEGIEYSVAALDADGNRSS